MRKSPELKEMLIYLYEAMSSGDAGRVEAFYSLKQGGLFIGTDAREWWADSEKHNADVRPFFDGSLGLLTWTAGEGMALREGSVGWTVDRPIISGAKGFRLQPRVTLVWHREGNAWKVVHSHASIGAE